MKASALRHLSFYPFVQPLARNRAQFLLEAASGDLSAAEMVWWKRTEPEQRHRTALEVRYDDGTRAQWAGLTVFPEEAHYIRYCFRMTDGEGKEGWLDAVGLRGDLDPAGCFELLQINETDVISVPEWAEGCVYYQVFPERFARGGAERSGLAEWDAAPTRENYLGGTLPGITQRIPYLADLGIECIYLNPVFTADFNHKYATTDYFSVDPQFGTERDLADLVDAAHRSGIRVILDGVFNHTGVHFPPFADLMRNGENSRYRDWFHPRRFPVTCSAVCYECVGDYAYMPRLNGGNPEVREYVRDVMLYWMEHARIDGWRFDVADELDRHAVIWWREEIRRKYPEAVLLCETWGDASRLLGPDGFDCAMNYPFRDAMVGFFAHGTLSEKDLETRLKGLLMRYPDPMNHAMYNCLGSHDTVRFLTECGGEKWRMKLAMAFQMLFPGAPAVYYGDELGMAGGNDPGCRGGMAWDRPDRELLAWEKELIACRKRHPAVRRGSFETLAADPEARVFAFRRTLGQDRVTAVFNMGETLYRTDFAEAEESVDVPPRSVKIITKT